MVEIVEELLVGVEEIAKEVSQAEDVLASWDHEKEEIQIELYFPKGRYRILRFGKIYEESNLQESGQSQ